MKIVLVREKIKPSELLEIIRDSYETMAKVVVDIKRNLATVGGEWHSDGMKILVENGSLPDDIWGCSVYPWEKGAERIEYISHINVKPALGQKSLEIQDSEVRNKIKAIVEELVIGPTEIIE